MDHADQVRILKLLDHVYDSILESLKEHSHQNHHELDNVEAEEYERSTLDPVLKIDCERVLNLCRDEDMANAGSSLLSTCEWD